MDLCPHCGGHIIDGQCFKCQYPERAECRLQIGTGGLKLCQNQSCKQPFRDGTKNHSRLYCDRPECKSQRAAVKRSRKV
jgi:hypothetical protein